MEGFNLQLKEKGPGTGELNFPALFKSRSNKIPTTSFSETLEISATESDSSSLLQSNYQGNWEILSRHS